MTAWLLKEIGAIPNDDLVCLNAQECKEQIRSDLQKAVLMNVMGRHTYIRYKEAD